MNVRFLVGDMTVLPVDAIVNPANSEGEMGSGVAASIKQAAGRQVEEEAMAYAPIPIGRAVVTSAGKLPCSYVVHAPIMKMPLQRTSVDNLVLATKAVLHVAPEFDIRSIAIPGMGTGTGRVPAAEAAEAMIDTIRKFQSPTGPLNEIVLVDMNGELVDFWERSWQASEMDELGA